MQSDKIKIYFDGLIYSWQTGGGVYRYFEELISRCRKNKGLEVILLMHTPTSNHLPNFLFRLFRKILSPINKLLFEKYFNYITSGIFHSTYYTTYKNLRIPQVLTVYDMTHEKFPHFFNSKGAKRFIANKKKCILKADAIICISEATKKALLNVYKIDNKKISVIYLGISENFLSDTQISINKKICLTKPYFLFVGNRGLYKNFNFLANAFSKWSKNKNYNLLLIGGGKLSKTEFDLIDELGLAKQIKHLGFIEEKDLKYIYQNSKAFVFPSLDEGFGFPILEAISNKTQVLASDIEAFREIGENMLIYFNPKKIGDLINALDQSISRNPTVEEFERRAKYVTAKFSWEKCFNQTIEIYKKVFDEKIS